MVTSHKKVYVALLLGIALIAFVVITKDKQNGSQENGELVVVTDAPERNYVQVTDSNNNGTPDWQESLVRTEIITPSTGSSTEWNPDSLTDQFSVAFFQAYVTNETLGPVSRPQEQLIAGATNALAEKAKDRLFTQSDIVIVATGDQESLRTYGNAIADIIQKYPYDGDSEIVVMQRAQRSNNPQDLEGLDPIILGYRGMIIDMQLLQVPEAYVTEHLNLLNAYYAVLNDVKAMRGAFDDPMLGMLRLSRYQDDVLGMAQALVNIGKKLTTGSGVQLGENDSLYQLLEGQI